MSTNISPTDSTQLKSFFNNLAERVRNENSVSDIFYSLLNTSDEFRVIMNRILKKNTSDLVIDLCRGGVHFQREYSTTTGVRPDLLISQATEKPIIIEFKLFDRNYHFKDYSDLLQNNDHEHIFLISAHQIDNKSLQPKWTILYWKDIVDDMDKSEDELVLSISTYFRSVTLSEKLEAIIFDSPRAMLFLNRMFKVVISNWYVPNTSYKTGLFPKSGSFGEKWSGYYYRLLSDKGIIADCYFGTFYGDDSNPDCIYLTVLKKSITDNYSKVEDQLRKKYTGLYKFNGHDQELSVKMESDNYREFLVCNNLDTQKELLNGFFNEFNNELLKAFSCL